MFCRTADSAVVRIESDRDGCLNERFVDLQYRCVEKRSAQLGRSGSTEGSTLEFDRTDLLQTKAVVSVEEQKKRKGEREKERES